MADRDRNWDNQSNRDWDRNRSWDRENDYRENQQYRDNQGYGSHRNQYGDYNRNMDYNQSRMQDQHRQDQYRNEGYQGRRGYDDRNQWGSGQGNQWSGSQNQGYGQYDRESDWNRMQGNYGQGGYTNFGRQDVRSNFQNRESNFGDSDSFGNRENQRRYGQSVYGGDTRNYGNATQGGVDRDWWDKTRDEVSSWFGDDDAERRRRMDQQREGQYRGKGPKGYTRSDERLHEDVCSRFSDDDRLDATNIEVKVENGEVVLTGTVNTRDQKRRAEDIAERISGVRDVENRIKVNRENDSNYQNRNYETLR